LLSIEIWQENAELDNQTGLYTALYNLNAIGIRSDIFKITAKHYTAHPWRPRG